ncbi:MAG: hypothetical protein ACN2B6_01265 [Rickettsiales bacterium]
MSFDEYLKAKGCVEYACDLSKEARIVLSSRIDAALDWVDAHELPGHIDMWPSDAICDFTDKLFEMIDSNHELVSYFDILIAKKLKETPLHLRNGQDYDEAIRHVIVNHEWIVIAVADIRSNYLESRHAAC